MITRVVSDITSPNGAPWAFDLGPKTLVVGRNGRGKTRVSHALRLVLTGNTDDLLGRNMVKDRGLLSTLIAKGASSVSAQATFASGEIATWSLTRDEDGTLKAPQHSCGIPADTVLPLRGVRALFLGDEAAARAALLTWIGGAATEVDVLAHVPAHLHDVYRQRAAAIPGSPADKLALVAEAAHTKALDIERDAAAQDRLVQQLGLALPEARPTDTEIEAMRDLANQWSVALNNAVAYEAQPPQAPLPTENLDELAAQQQEAATAAAFWRTRALEAQTAVDAAVRAAYDASTTVDHCAAVLRASAEGTCLACGSNYGPDHVAQRRAWFEQQQGVPPNLAQADASRSSLREAQQNAEGWQAEVTRLQALIADVNRRGELAMRPRLPSPGVSAADAKVNVDAALARLNAMSRVAGAWEQVTKAKDMAAELRSTKPMYQELATAGKVAAEALLDALTEDFSKRVQAFMPEDMMFGLQLRDGERSVCRVTVNGGMALSGVQRDTVAVAIAMVVSASGGGATTGKKAKKGAATPARYTLVIPEDRDRDEVTLGELMRAWTNYPGQVILEATRRPKGKMPAGWTVIDIDAWLQQIGAEGHTGALPEVDVPAAASAEAGAEDPAPPPPPVVEAPLAVEAQPAAVEPPVETPADPPAAMQNAAAAPAPTPKLVGASVDDVRTALRERYGSKLDSVLAEDVARSIADEGRSVEVAVERYALRQLQQRQEERARAAEPVPPAQPSLFEVTTLAALGFSEEKAAKIPEEAKACILQHRVPPARVLLVANKVTVFDEKGVPLATFER